MVPLDLKLVLMKSATADVNVKVDDVLLLVVDAAISKEPLLEAWGIPVACSVPPRATWLDCEFSSLASSAALRLFFLKHKFTIGTGQVA